MSRVSMAFSCFFGVLFKGKLPPAAATLVEGREALPAAPPRSAPEAATPAPKVEAAKPAPKPEAPKVPVATYHKEGAMALWAALQREGRLVDFLREPLDGFADADIGAAARDVHRGCRKVLEQQLTLEPVMPGAEEAKVTVPAGFDPSEIRLIGEAHGQGPFQGTLRHHGWRATDVRFPALTEGVNRAVVAAAEVELA